MIDGYQHGSLHVWIECLKEGRASSTYCVLYHTSRLIWQDGQYAVRGLVQENRIRNSKCDGRATDLRERDEANGQGNHVRFNFDLSNCEGCLGVHAGSETEQDCVSVNLRVGGVHFNGVHERTANESETAACEVPRHVDTVFRHEGAVEHDGENENADEREETDPCLDSGVVPRKLKEEWDEVHRYEENVCRGGRLNKEDDKCFVLEELAREDSVFFCRHNSERLLQAKDNEQNAGYDETGDYLAGVPGIDDAAEVYCHDARNTGTDHEKRSDVV